MPGDGAVVGAMEEILPEKLPGDGGAVGNRDVSLPRDGSTVGKREVSLPEKLLNEGAKVGASITEGDPV